MDNNAILDAIDSIKKQNLREVSEKIFEDLSNLEEDIKNDFFTIVVLGEFKRGKSTFVNSVLGNRILPMDVIPTTATINALMWSDEEKTVVVKNDGTTEIGESSLEFLNRYTASEDFDIDNIKYLKVGYNSEVLKNKTVIVDTPGVSDINEHRVKVTYDFIPRADAVIFLLDATSPLKKTEKEFIDEHLIKLGIERVIFVANKFDYIDEDEEEDAQIHIEKRLKKAFGSDEKQSLSDLSVYPMSSSMALEGVMKGDAELIESSGLTAVKDRIDKITEEGSVASEKNKHYQKRLLNIIDMIERDIRSSISLQRADREKLIEALAKIDKMIDEKADRKEKVGEYIANEERNILTMVRKSLSFFHMSLREEINESIDMYKGEDFKDYIEKSLSKSIRKKMNGWIKTYSASVDKLLEKLEKEVSIGLAKYFKANICVKGSQPGEGSYYIESGGLIGIEAEDISGVSTQVGLISAGLSGVMMLVGGPILVPFVSMAAFPVLRKKMLENKLNDAKLALKPEISKALDESMMRLGEEIARNIVSSVENIRQSTEAVYDQKFNWIREQIQREIDTKQDDRDVLDKNIESLSKQLKILEEKKRQLLIEER